LVPFVGADIHLKSLNKLTGIDKVFLSEVKLANFSVVLSNLFVVGAGNLGLLV